MSEQMGRRGFLRGAGALAAAALAGGRAEKAQAQEKPANVEQGVLEQGVLPMERFEEVALASLDGLLNHGTEALFLRADVFGSRILVNYGPLAVYNKTFGIETDLMRKREDALSQHSIELAVAIGLKSRAILSSRNEAYLAYRQFRLVVYEYLRFVQYKHNLLDDSKKSGREVDSVISDLLNKKIDPTEVHAAAIELANKNNKLLRILADLSLVGQ